MQRYPELYPQEADKDESATPSDSAALTSESDSTAVTSAVSSDSTSPTDDQAAS